jgi:hypothetical protein
MPSRKFNSRSYKNAEAPCALVLSGAQGLTRLLVFN